MRRIRIGKRIVTMTDEQCARYIAARNGECVDIIRAELTSFRKTYINDMEMDYASLLCVKIGEVDENCTNEELFEKYLYLEPSEHPLYKMWLETSKYATMIKLCVDNGYSPDFLKLLMTKYNLPSKKTSERKKGTPHYDDAKKNKVAWKAYNEYMNGDTKSAAISIQYGYSNTWLDSYICIHNLPRKRTPDMKTVFPNDETNPVYQYWLKNDVSRKEACMKFKRSPTYLNTLIKRANLHNNKISRSDELC
ncbi:MAG: hypothetical protein ACRC92_18685 [Peptostreptococcaceae bacterium]